MVHLLKMVIFHGYVSHNQMVTIPLRPCDNAKRFSAHLPWWTVGFLTKKTQWQRGAQRPTLWGNAVADFSLSLPMLLAASETPVTRVNRNPRCQLPSHGISLTSWLHRMPKALDSLDALVCNKLNPSCSQASDVASVRLLPGKDVFDMPCRTCSANGQRILQRICKWDINGLVGS